VASRHLHPALTRNIGNCTSLSRKRKLPSTGCVWLWEEPCADYADCQTYAYSQYCENYRRFAKQIKRSMRQIHRAGEEARITVVKSSPNMRLTFVRRKPY
jgi:hypothetical protein